MSNLSKCENCDSDHNGEYGSGRFCSSKCARGFSTKAKRTEINEKVSRTLTKDPYKKICDYCKTEFTTKRKRIKFCSRVCGIKNAWLDDEYRLRMSKLASITATERHRLGNTNFGWQNRNKFEMSYPEKIANNELLKYDVNFINEYHFHPYFIDFALIDYKIAIEIDGQQHNLPERKASDIKKDKKLIKNGWTVYRLSWPNDNIKDGIKEIMSRIPSH